MSFVLQHAMLSKEDRNDIHDFMEISHYYSGCTCSVLPDMVQKVQRSPQSPQRHKALLPRGGGSAPVSNLPTISSPVLASYEKVLLLLGWLAGSLLRDEGVGDCVVTS